MFDAAAAAVGDGEVMDSSTAGDWIVAGTPIRRHGCTDNDVVLV